MSQTDNGQAKVDAEWQAALTKRVKHQNYRKREERLNLRKKFTRVAAQLKITPESVAKQPLPKKPKKLGGFTGKGFMPGQSGNPLGRARGRIELGALIRRFLGEIDPAEAEKITKGLLTMEKACTRLQKLMERLVVDDPRTLLAYGFGKPVETIELAGNSEAEGEPRIPMTPTRLLEVATWLDKTAPKPAPDQVSNGTGSN